MKHIKIILLVWALPIFVGATTELTNMLLEKNKKENLLLAGLSQESSLLFSETSISAVKFIKPYSSKDTVNENAQTCVGINYQSPVRYEFFRGPDNAVGVADFNNDGKPDILVGSGVLLGTGTGTFVSGGCHEVGGKPVDLNGDGKIDLVGNYVDTLRTAFGNGNGTFTNGPTSSIGLLSVELDTGDINRDGKADVVISNPNDERVSVMIGRGDGTFFPPVRYNSGTTPRTILLRDFNNDNLLDILITNSSGISIGNSVSVLLGNGDGTFLPRIISSAGLRPFDAVSGDFNEDGLLDLVLSHQEPNTSLFNTTITILISNGNGSFQHPFDINVGATPNSAGIVVADFNNDRHLDIGTTLKDEVNGVSIVLGNGDGTFKSPKAYLGAPRTVGLVAADFNLDGKVDLATSNLNNFGSPIPTDRPGDIPVLLGKGDGGFYETGNIYFPEKTFDSLVITDFDSDGKLDIVVAEEPSIGRRFYVGINNGDGTLRTNQIYTGPLNYAETGEIKSGDVNNDGRPDIITASSTVINIGNGNFSSPIDHFAILGGSIDIGDFNRDGNLDIVGAIRNSNQLVLLNGNGDGTFAFNNYFAVGNLPESVLATDLNFDGFLDVIVSNTNFILLGSGNGTFIQAQSPLSGCSKCIKADFNNDGLLDYASFSPGNSSAIAVYLNRGAGQFASAVLTQFPSSNIDREFYGQGASVGDLNGDNIPDLVIGIFYNIAVAFGNGDGSFRQPIKFIAQKRNWLTATGDFNNDNRLDIVTLAKYGGLGVILADCPPAAPSISMSSVSNPAYAGSPVMLTAILTANNQPISEGFVIFREFCDVLGGPVPVSANGLATITVSNLTVGRHNITAEYSGSNNFTTKSIDFIQEIIPHSANIPPNISGQNIPRQRGDDGAISPIAIVNDDLTPPGNLTVTLGAIPPGISIGNIINNNGTITAMVGANCSANLGNNVVPIQVTDGNGLTANGTLTINVTPNPSPTATITNPPGGATFQIGAPVNFVGGFMDNNGDEHTAEWTFSSTSGSFSQPGTVDENNRTANTSTAFTMPGVYLVSLAVRDKCGNLATANTVNNDLQAMVVIFDPNGGFVTGGGWIDSPAGAFRSNPSLSGKASFGFVSKYQHGANVPAGDTDFRFRTANFNFSSTNYEWLVVAGARAQFKGSGTINGSGDYAFMLTAIDGQMPGGGGADRFRIRIWDKMNGGIIYDNQTAGDMSDNGEPNTVIGGGNIVIHRP